MGIPGIISIVIGLIGSMSYAFDQKSVNCSNPIYRSPALIQQINYMEGAEPLCTQDFLEKIKTEKREPNCEKLIQKMAHIAEKNVRTFHCPGQGPMNVVFISDRVFLTNSHAYNESIKHGNINLPGDLLKRSVISRCYVDRFDPNAGVSGKGMFVRDYVDMDIPPRKGDPNSPSGDFAIGAVKDTITDIEPIDIISKPDSSVGAEMFSAAAFSVYSKVNNCFSLTSCHQKEEPFSPESMDESTVHVTTCPVFEGASGSGVFTILRDKQGQCKSIGLMAIMEGGVTNGPNGSSYFYSGDDANYLTNPRTMWSEVVGIDNKFRADISEVIEDVKNQHRDYSESAPKEPSGQDL